MCVSTAPPVRTSAQQAQSNCRSSLSKKVGKDEKRTQSELCIRRIDWLHNPDPSAKSAIKS
jgi:hypothetical protein